MITIDLDKLLGSYREYWDGKNVSFKHITRRLVQNMMNCSDLGRPEDVHRARETLQKYIFLLDEFPDFRQEELTTDAINDRGGGDTEDYVNRRYYELKGKRVQ